MSIETPSPQTLLEKVDFACGLRVPKFVKLSATKGGAGFLGSLVLNILNPFSGAVYASTQSVMHQLLWPGVKELLSEEDNLPSRIYIYAVTFLFSSTVAISMTLSLGLPMSIPAALYLSVSLIPITFLIDYFFQNLIAAKK